MLLTYGLTRYQFYGAVLISEAAFAAKVEELCRELGQRGRLQPVVARLRPSEGTPPQTPPARGPTAAADEVPAAEVAPSPSLVAPSPSPQLPPVPTSSSYRQVVAASAPGLVHSASEEAVDRYGLTSRPIITTKRGVWRVWYS
jgi:hypothetical protein